MAKNVISALCLFLMVLVTGGVLGFYYYAGLEKDVAPVSSMVNNDSTKNENVNVEKTLAQSFFSHDVLNVETYCVEALAACLEIDEFDENLEKIDFTKFDFISINLLNKAMDYRVKLASSLLAELAERLSANRLSLENFEKNIDGRKIYEDVAVQGIFDRQNPGIVYILFSYLGQVAESPEIIGNPGVDEVAAYAVENKIYKYDLLADDFEDIYSVYQMYGDGAFVVKEDGLMVGLSEIRGINENNDLLIGGSINFGMTGMGGGPYQFGFEGLNPWMPTYLLKNGSDQLVEYKYTQDNDSYNADLYRFLLLEYYPKHFKFVPTSGGPEDYSQF